MDLFIDSSDPQEIEEVRSWGLLSGVTTNPGLIPKAGPDMSESLNRVIDASPGPVLAQVIGWNEPETMIAQAKWLHEFSDRITVKLPMSISGLQALQRLKQDLPELKIAVTLVASLSQAYLCGKAGADIVAIFNGPLDQDSDSPVLLIPEVRKIYDNYGFATKILSAGRFPRLFGQVAAAGTDICTLNIDFWRLLYEHAYTDKRIDGFLGTWQATFGDKTWLDEGQERDLRRD